MKEIIIDKINLLINKIEKIYDDGEFKGYIVHPYLKEIIAFINREKSNDKDTLLDLYKLYGYVALVYKRMTRFYLVSQYLELQLNVAIDLFINHHTKVDNIDELLFDLLRSRNYYIDDDCLYLIDLVKESKIMSDENIDKLHQKVMSRRRSFNSDPVEMSKEYLDVIDEVEEKVEQNRTIFGMGACHEIWNLKQQFLLEKGIIWKSPADLNPRVKFD